MKYTTLLFDADGTLYDFEKAEIIALTNLYRKSEITCSFKKFRGVYERENKKLWKALEKGSVTADQVKVERFSETLKALDIHGFDGYEMSRLFMEELADCQFLLPGAEELIKKLYRKYDLYIITNGLWDVQKKRIGESLIYKKYFKDMIVSEKVGSAKPDRAIFEEACRIAGNPPINKILMIGDSLTSDIRGGDLFGMDTCWINLEGKDMAGLSYPTYTVQTFSELEAILL